MKKTLTEKEETQTEIPLLSPFDITGSYSHFPAKEFRGECHYELQICVVLHGAAEVVQDDFSRVYHAGELWWNMCWEPHSYRFVEKRTFVVAINLDVEHLGACSPFGGCNWLMPFIVESSRRYCPETEEEKRQACAAASLLYHLRQKKEENWRIRSWLTIHDLLLTAIRKMREPVRMEDDGKGRRSGNEFARIRYALNKVWGLESKPPSLPEAAEMCSLSLSRFSELFRKAMGISYGKFAIRVRMSNAAKDLLSGHYSIDELAGKWGFYDTAHFCHSFKQYYKISPNQFVMKNFDDNKDRKK